MYILLYLLSKRMNRSRSRVKKNGSPSQKKPKRMTQSGTRKLDGVLQTNIPTRTEKSCPKQSGDHAHNRRPRPAYAHALGLASTLCVATTAPAPALAACPP